MKPDRALLECLLKIRNLNEFSPFRDYLETELRETMMTMINCNDDRQMHCHQGAVRKLTALHDLIDGAPGLLDKERHRQGGN